MTECDIAWAAGLFEGEGYIVARPVTSHRVFMQVGLETRDRDVLERFVDIARELGGARRTQRPRAEILLREKSKRNPNYSDTYSWSTTGHPARRIYDALKPHLGQRRRTKGDAIAAECARTAHEREHRTCDACGEPSGTRMYCSENCRARVRMQDPEQRRKARARQALYHERYRDKINAAERERYHRKKAASMDFGREAGYHRHAVA